MGNVDMSVKGTPFTKKTFNNTILAVNMELWKFLAGLLFDGDQERIVWSSSEKMFRNRTRQLQARNKGDNLGLLDIPFASFKLKQDGVNNGADRQWFNQALNVEGEYHSELGRKLKMTPVTLNYESVFCCQHDTDLHFAQQKAIWTQSNETIIKPSLSTVRGDMVTPIDIPLIGVLDITPQMNSRFTENDWLIQNKIQTVEFDIKIQTFLLGDNTSGFGLVKKVIFDFMGETFPDIHLEGDVDRALEEVVFSD